MNDHKEELMLDLLIKKATEGLTSAEQLELDQLTDGRPDEVTFELAAAALAMSEVTVEEMPPHLRSKILTSADREFSDQASRAESASVIETEPGGVLNLAWLGWAFAALLVAVFAAYIIFFERSPQPRIVQNPTPTPVKSADEKLSLDALLASNAVNARADWANGNVKDLAGKVSGKIVWSDELQKGFMVFSGLPKNDREKETYQLWIFDETQDAKTPIDGGVFDITAEGEAIIPIDAKLNVKNPAMFAITIEKPGGVVVSDRKKIAALAKVQA